MFGYSTTLCMKGLKGTIQGKGMVQGGMAKPGAAT